SSCLTLLLHLCRLRRRPYHPAHLIHPTIHLFLFFFQAEDGIRDRNVTGVQTCALPIFWGEDVPGQARRVEGEPPLQALTGHPLPASHRRTSAPRRRAICSPASAARTCGPAGASQRRPVELEPIAASSTWMPRPGASPSTRPPSATSWSRVSPTGARKSCSSVARWLGTAAAACATGLVS